MHDDDRKPMILTLDELKAEALRVAEQLKASGGETPAASGGGSRQRGLPEKLRIRFVDVRAALFQRGIFDPVLVRFDTATAPQASTAEVGERLAAVATNL